MTQMNISEAFKKSLILKAVDHTRIGITITDPSLEDNPIIYVNDGFTEMTGYPAEESLGRNCRFLQGEDRDKGAIKQLKQAINNRLSTSVELLNYKKNGEQFWNEIYIEPLEMDGKSYFLGVQKDITKQKHYEQDLALSKQQVSSLSTPIVPITDDIAILPVIGDLSYDRFEIISDKIAQSYSKMHYSYLILDLSGMEDYDDQVVDSIINLCKLLKLLGAELIITGIHPRLSISLTTRNISLPLIKTATNVKEVLKSFNIMV
ncbi:PAS domain-containing protein [Alteribacillus sp. HJP-4]|uniref:STAS domain-containing protein n=1 Tax=Alteribacillus sp. HJP-4 TaxID=2775394 RepID=UPI0035CD0D82